MNGSSIAIMQSGATKHIKGTSHQSGKNRLSERGNAKREREGVGSSYMHVVASWGICHGYLPISSGPKATDIRIVPMILDTGGYVWHRPNHCILLTGMGFL